MDKPIEGFTLIETMVVLMVMGIILGLGMPSFMDLVEKIRTESEAETIIESLRTARLTAIERKKTIVLCASNDGATCGDNWDDGFMVFLAADGDGDPDNEADILLKHEFRDSVLVQNPGANRDRFVFDSDGLTISSAGSLLVCASDDSNKNGYRIAINRAGRLRVEDSKVTWKNGSGATLNC